MFRLLGILRNRVCRTRNIASAKLVCRVRGVFCGVRNRDRRVHSCGQQDVGNEGVATRCALLAFVPL